MAVGSTATKHRVMLLGNFLSQKRKGGQWVCETLEQCFRGVGWRVYSASNCEGRLARLLDMTLSCIRHRADFDVALVDVYSGKAFYLAEWICCVLRILRKPYVLSLHGGRLPEFSANRQRRVLRLLRNATAVTAPSPWMCSQMKPYFEHVSFLPNPVDLTRFQTDVRQRIRPRLVWVRAFESMYCPEMALEVLYQLRSFHADAKLTLVGRDKLDGSLDRVKKKIISLRLEDSVAIVPGVPNEEIPKYLSDADIFINTSRVDNAPVSVVEALAGGLCVVSTSVGGIADLVDDGRTGMLVARDDVAGMVAAIRRIIRDQSFSTQMGNVGRQSVSKYAVSEVVDRWQEVFSLVQREQ